MTKAYYAATIYMTKAYYAAAIILFFDKILNYHTRIIHYFPSETAISAVRFPFSVELQANPPGVGIRRIGVLMNKPFV